MIGSIKAELRKLRRRPAYLIATGIAVAVVVVVYSLNYAQATWSAAPAVQRALDKLALYPAAFVLNVIGAAFPLGAALAVVLGALASGAEYSWGTLKTVLTQRPGRLETLSGRVVAVGLYMGLLSALLYVVGAASSLAVALIDGHSVSWPSALVIVEAIGATWLILFCYAMLGMGLAFVFRQSAAAIGVGLIYIVLLQTIFVRFVGGLGAAYHWVIKVFDGENSSSLIHSFGSVIPDLHKPPELMSATEATMVLAAYAVLFVFASAMLIWRRDVT